MSQRQLMLVFSSSKKRTAPLKLNSLKSKKSPAPCSESSLVAEYRQLLLVHPAAARLIGQLIRDALLEAWTLPPLE